MAAKNQARESSETGISVDMNAEDPAKAVSRAKPNDIAASVRDDADDGRPRSKVEKQLFQRMNRFGRSLERQFDQRAAAREAEHQREIAALKDRIDKITVDRGGAGDQADAAHETAINALKDKLAAAYEKGDSAECAKISTDISRLEGQYWAKKASAAGVATREAAAVVDPAKQQPQNKGPTVAGSRFIRANEDWWDEPEFEIEKAAANSIYLKLVNQEGFDPKDEETFKEVAKQLKEKFPNLEAKSGSRKGPGDDEDDDDEIDAGQGGEDRQQRRPAPASRIEDRGEASGRNRGTRRTLTKQEIETMKACRLDPENDRDVVQFMREAQAMEQAS